MTVKSINCACAVDSHDNLDYIIYGISDLLISVVVQIFIVNKIYKNHMEYYLFLSSYIFQ